MTIAVVLIASVPALPQGAVPAGGPSTTPRGPTPPLSSSVNAPAGYVIGPDDVLAVVFWREKDLSVDEAVVRPDGQITVPLVNDIRAAGLTPDQLREQIQAAAAKFVADPSVTVVVKTINSRKVFITGQVAKPGQYPLTAPTTVMQLISLAGGLHEFADSKKILIMRTQGAQQTATQFNYQDVLNRKNLKQNIELQPGDTIVVP
jgi:polysaccharide export outer membrane protein